MPKAKNPLKWQGVDALSALGLCQFKLPRRIGSAPVFCLARSEITPFFVYTPHLKWGTVYTGGILGLSFAGIDDFVNSAGKINAQPPLTIHTANFPGDLARYISPDEAERGAFKDWAVLMDHSLRYYPTSAEELSFQLQEGRLGGFRAAQQLGTRPPNDALNAWFAHRDIAIPPDEPGPIQAVSVLPVSVQ